MLETKKKLNHLQRKKICNGIEEKIVKNKRKNWNGREEKIVTKRRKKLKIHFA